MADLYRYAAFISYSSKDAAFAHRLHRALESYGIPASLGKFDLIGGGKKNRIYPVFRDREELSAGHLGDQIEANLKASAALIVVCSPNGAASPWVQKEIQFFAALRRDRIFAIIPDTAPLIDERGADLTRACFPPAFRGDALQGDQLEPLAADARKGKDGFRNAWLKLVAGMIGIGPGQLIDRDKRRARARVFQSSIAALAAVSVIGFGASWLLSIQLEARSNTLAEIARGASNNGLYERAARYARAGLTGWDHPLIGFNGAAADAELRRAVAQSPLRTVLRGHEDVVWSATFSPDGTRILTVSDDDTARVWDVATGRELAALREHRGHRDQTISAAFSPDGTHVITTGERTARVWDSSSGREVAALGHDNFVSSAVFSPDGTRIVTTSEDNTARVWRRSALNDATWRELTEFSQPIVGDAASFSPDGTRIVTVDSRVARVWDSSTGREIIVLRGHGSFLLSAAFSPDGTRIVTASQDNTARVWDSRSGREIVTLSGHESAVYRAEFSRDGRRIITVSGDNTARVWDSRSGSGSPVTCPESWLSRAAFSPDGARVIAACGDGTARVWVWGRTDTEIGNPIFLEIAVLRGHGDALKSAVFSPDGTLIVTASVDNTARVWNSNGEIAALSGHEGRVESAAFSPDGTRIVSASGDRTARVWGRPDANSAGWRQLAVLRGHEDQVTSTTFSPDGTRILTASEDETARVWGRSDTSDVAWREFSVLRGHELPVRAAAFSPDGTRIFTASTDNTTRVWDSATGNEIVALRRDSYALLTAFSPDGNRVLTASNGDMAARLSGRSNSNDVAWHELAALRGHTARVQGAGFSPDGTRIVTASEDQTARVWDSSDGREIVVLRGHGGWVTSAAFSPDGTRIVTASSDDTSRVWDVATGREIVALQHPGWVTSAVFSPDGREVVTASFDGVVRVWRLNAVMFENRRALLRRVCSSTLPDSTMSRFSVDELRDAPVLDPNVNADACHLPSLWGRFKTLVGLTPTSEPAAVVE